MSLPPGRLMVVTVTYGERWPLLSRLLEHVQQSAMIAGAVVVDNGSPYPVAQRVEEAGLAKTSTVRLPSNSGSAEGFRLAIETAMASGADWLWLLDDDNLPRAGALECLFDTYHRHCPDASARTAPIGLLALRPDRSEFVEALAAGRNLFVRENTFRDFSPGAFLWRRLVRRFARPRVANMCGADAICVGYAPYGGLLMPRRTVQQIGLPDPRFILYGDDHEYAHRIVKKGGSIHLCAHALVDDLDVSWNRRDSAMHPLLDPESPERKVWLSVRNRVFWERTTFVSNRPRYYFNMVVYLVLLAARGILGGGRARHVMSRLMLVIKAIRDGLHMAGGRHPVQR